MNNTTPFNPIKSINTFENKQFIWDLLFENGSFNKLDTNQVKIIHNKYDKIVSDIESQHTNDSKINKNKKLIYSINENINTLFNSTQNINIKPPITAEEITSKRKEEFNNILLEKKEEFDSLITVKKPENIDFSDKKDVPIDNINDVLSSVVANRNNNIDFFKPSQKNKFTNSIKIGEPIENSRENSRENSINTIKSSNDIQLQIVLDKIINIEKTQNKILDKISNLQFSNNDNKIIEN